MKIVIDPGHGGKDPGATCKYGTEADSNLRCALLLERELKDWGVEVILTRRDDNITSFESAQRAEMANRLKADALISLHADSASPGPAGHHAIVSMHGTESKRLGQLVSDHIARITGVKAFRAPWTRALPGNPKQDYYAIVRNAKMPAILLERGFLTTDTDAKRLFDDGYLAKQALGIAQGIAEWAKLLRLQIEGRSELMPLINIGSKTYAPVRALGEGLGCSVHWDGKENMVTVKQRR